MNIQHDITPGKFDRLLFETIDKSDAETLLKVRSDGVNSKTNVISFALQRVAAG